MTLNEAIKGISVSRFYRICGYTYHDTKHLGHGTKQFKELPPNMQWGIILLTKAIYRVQKMVYSYELEYTVFCMKDCGIKLRPFFALCNISPTFFRTLSLAKNNDNRLMSIRMQLIRIVNRLLDYITET